MGALEASRDIETGQVVSRAVPVPGPKVEPGSRAAMADQGSRAAMADQVIRAAMMDQVIRAAMADQGPPWAMVGSPHQKMIYWRSLGGAFWCGLCELLDRSGHWSGLGELL